MADDTKKDAEDSSHIPVTNDSTAPVDESHETVESKENTIQKYQPNVNFNEPLITAAVHFLLNPRMKDVPLHQKRAFLLKKGLTNDDISIALNRVENSMERSLVESAPIYERQNLAPYQPNYPGTMAVYQAPPSLWLRWRELCSSIMVIGATCYGFYYFFKQYIEPIVIGKKRHEEDRMTKIERHLTELNRSLSQLRHSLISVESALTRHQEKDSSETNSGLGLSGREITDLKTEVGSIKSLLLSRTQFPAAPPSSLSIPAWQRKQKEVEEFGEGEEKESGGKEQNLDDENKEADPSLVKEVDPEVFANGIMVNGELSAH